MEFSEYKTGFCKRWQRHIVRSCWNMFFVLLAIEIIVFFIFLYTHTLDTHIFRYLLLRVILPSGINFCALLVSSFLLHRPDLNIKQKNYIASFLFLTFSGIVSLFHNYYPIVFIVPGIAVFFCALLTDQKLLKIVFIFSLVILTASILEWLYMEYQQTFAYTAGTILSAVVFDFCCYIIARGILLSQQDQVQFIYDGYVKQQQLINELRLEPLTRLYNRTALNDVAQHCIAQYCETDGLLMLALIDLDNFKNVNDHYGHASGDAVLISFASLLVKTFGGNRNVFRYGGDEFMLLFKDKTLKEVEDIAEQIRTEFSNTRFEFIDVDYYCTISMGIAAYHVGMTNKEWFDTADSAAYAAKTAGKNQFVVVL
jgi:diguanylate cyclase (GGDEF)-like protein